MFRGSCTQGADPSVNGPRRYVFLSNSERRLREYPKAVRRGLLGVWAQKDSTENWNARPRRGLFPGSPGQVFQGEYLIPRSHHERASRNRGDRVRFLLKFFDRFDRDPFRAPVLQHNEHFYQSKVVLEKVCRTESYKPRLHFFL